jgi:hypothetical protein
MAETEAAVSPHFLGPDVAVPTRGARAPISDALLSKMSTVEIASAPMQSAVLVRKGAERFNIKCVVHANGGRNGLLIR